MKQLILIGVICAGTAWACSPALAQGRGIGRGVSNMARNGVHGQALASRVHQLQAAQGIGRVNGQGQSGPFNGGVPASNAKPGKGQAGQVLGKGKGGQGMVAGPGMGQGGQGGHGRKPR